MVLKSYLAVFMTNFVDVVVEQFVNQVDVGQEHSSAAVPCESDFIKYLSNILGLFHLFSSLSNKLAELIPLMSDNFPTTEATHWYNHVWWYKYYELTSNIDCQINNNQSLHDIKIISIVIFVYLKELIWKKIFRRKSRNINNLKKLRTLLRGLWTKKRKKCRNSYS